MSTCLRTFCTKSIICKTIKVLKLFFYPIWCNGSSLLISFWQFKVERYTTFISNEAQLFHEKFKAKTNISNISYWFYIKIDSCVSFFTIEGLLLRPPDTTISIQACNNEEACMWSLQLGSFLITKNKHIRTLIR